MNNLRIILICILAIIVVNNVSAQKATDRKATRKANKGQVEPYLQSQLLDSITILNNAISLKAGEIRSLKEKLDTYVVEDFLKIDNISIFDRRYDSLFDFDDKKIPKYCIDEWLLIKKIRNLSAQLLLIEKKISDSNVEQLVKSASLSKEAAKSTLLNDSKKDLLIAEKLIEEIDTLDKKFLTESQLEYYRPSLINKYNKLLDIIYPNNP
jgi:hypothetical protein